MDGELYIYPNPSQGTFFINASGKVDAYNSFGQRIATFESGEAILSKGLYLLRSGKFSKKLVIE